MEVAKVICRGRRQRRIAARRLVFSFQPQLKRPHNRRLRARQARANQGKETATSFDDPRCRGPPRASSPHQGGESSERYRSSLLHLILRPCTSIGPLQRTWYIASLTWKYICRRSRGVLVTGNPCSDSYNFIPAFPRSVINLFCTCSIATATAALNRQRYQPPFRTSFATHNLLVPSDSCERLAIFFPVRFELKIRENPIRSSLNGPRLPPAGSFAGRFLTLRLDTCSFRKPAPLEPPYPVYLSPMHLDRLPPPHASSNPHPKRPSLLFHFPPLPTSVWKFLHFYRKRAEQRPMTSPWHTSSALNSDPSSVR